MNKRDMKDAWYKTMARHLHSPQVPGDTIRFFEEFLDNLPDDEPTVTCDNCADKIMKQFDEAIKNLKEWVEDESKQKPEWEEILDELTAGEWDKFRLEEIFKGFMKREFKAMGEEIIQPDNGIIELSAYPSEAYRQGIYDMKYKVYEALRKRGVK